MRLQQAFRLIPFRLALAGMQWFCGTSLLLTPGCQNALFGVFPNPLPRPSPTQGDVDDWIDDLTSSITPRRDRAAQFLVSHLDKSPMTLLEPKHVPALVAALGQTSPIVQEAAFRGIAFLRQHAATALPLLLSLRASEPPRLASKDYDEALDDALGKLGAAALPKLSAALTTSGGRSRCRLARPLAQAAALASQFETIERLLADLAPCVRSGGLVAFSGRFGLKPNDALADRLARVALSDPEPSIRENAAKALGATPRSPATARAQLFLLDAALRGADERIRRVAVSIMVYRRPVDPRGVDLLITALSDASEEVQHEAAHALARHAARCAKALPAVIRAISRPHTNIWAIRFIEALGPAAALAAPALVDSLRRRRAALEANEKRMNRVLEATTHRYLPEVGALASIGVGALPAIRPLADDPTPLFREIAIELLTLAALPEDLPAVRRAALFDANPWVRRTAAGFIGRFGPAGLKALEEP